MRTQQKERKILCWRLLSSKVNDCRCEFFGQVQLFLVIFTRSSLFGYVNIPLFKLI